MEHKGCDCSDLQGMYANIMLLGISRVSYLVFLFYGFFFYLILNVFLSPKAIACIDSLFFVGKPWFEVSLLIYDLILVILQLCFYKKHRMYAREFISPDNGDTVVDASPKKTGIMITLKRDGHTEDAYIDYKKFHIKVKSREDISIPIFHIKNGYVRKVDNPLHFDEDSKDLYEIINESA